MIKSLLSLSREHVTQAGAIGLFQGLFGYVLFSQITASAQNHLWLFPCRVLILLLPITWPVACAVMPRQKALMLAAVQGLLLAGMTAYGSSMYYANAYPWMSAMPFFLVANIFLVWSISLIFACGYERGRSIGKPLYTCLYSAKMGIACTFSFAVLVTGVFWALLGTWGGLFKILHISFFANLFAREWFICVATSTVVALSISAARIRFVESDTTLPLVTGFGHSLLPLSSAIVLTFLAALPFTGLQPLWDTHMATWLMLWLQFLFMLLAMSAYGDGSTACAYPKMLQKIISVALALLPLFTLLCGYALYLRISEYGLTVDRVWAALMTALTGFTVCGYALAVLKPKGNHFLKGSEPVNIGLAGLIFAVCFLTSTPVLSPERLSAESQVSRLLAGRIDAGKFDYHYLRFQLGTYGTEALQNLKALQNHPQAEQIRKAAEAALKQENRFTPAPVEIANIRDKISLFPAGATWDPAFEKMLSTLPIAKSCANSYENCVVLSVDLNGDGVPDYVLLNSYSSTVFQQAGGEWKETGTLHATRYAPAGGWRKQIQQSGFELKPSEWKTLHIGDADFIFMPPTVYSSPAGRAPLIQPVQKIQK